MNIFCVCADKKETVTRKLRCDSLFLLLGELKNRVERRETAADAMVVQGEQLVWLDVELVDFQRYLRTDDDSLALLLLPRSSTSLRCTV